MTGDFDSVIGMTKDEPLNRFLRKVPGGEVRAGDRRRHAVRDRGRDRRRERACGESRRRPARRHSGGSAAEILGLGSIVSFEARFARPQVTEQLTATRGDDSVSDGDSPACAGSGIAARHGGNDLEPQSQSGARYARPSMAPGAALCHRRAGANSPPSSSRPARACSISARTRRCKRCCRTAAAIKAATASPATAGPPAISRAATFRPRPPPNATSSSCSACSSASPTSKTCSPTCASASRTSS